MDMLEEFLNKMLNALPTILDIKQKCIHYIWEIDGQERGAIVQVDIKGNPSLSIYKKVGSKRMYLYEGYSHEDAAWCLRTGEEHK